MRGESLAGRDVDLHEHVRHLADAGLGVGLDGEAELLRVLGDLDRRDADRVRRADELGDGFAFERTLDLEVGGHQAGRADLHRRERDGVSGYVGRFGRQHGERRGVVHAALAGVGFALDDELPGLGIHVGVGTERELALGGVGGDGLLAERGDARRRPAHEDADGALEAFLALGDDLQVEDAIAHERGLRRLDLERVRGFVDHGDGELVLDALVVDDVADADDVVGAAHPADDRVGRILRQEQRGDDGAAVGRVGRGFEHERHAGQAAGGFFFEQFHAGGQSLEVEAVVAAHAVAGEVLQQHHAPALGDGHELAVAGVVDGVVRRSEGEARLRGDHLDAVDEVGAPSLEVIGDAHGVDTVDRSGELETGVEATHAAAVVVADDGRALGCVHVDDRIEGRT